ncbi:Autoinducer 2 import system permease protein LsrC [Frondihabitans sp. 762G35]|uniref:ABC transporter permease n=1 Tax=Frondihabitans sp. 762G35 TaxID=1446794 RepID=UPI000D228CD7|nr:ABC transporter permease [Frondihabitans sp. 762G35]ARC57474.1 Autoinducer 2 import system permease protein LsrC [Frondihabitans sp. 762G35]
MSDSTTQAAQDAAAPTTQAVPPSGPPAGGESRGDRTSGILREIVSSNAMVSVLAVVLALVLSGILIAATDPTVQSTAGYFFARPSDLLSAAWKSVSLAYSSIFQGAIVNFQATDFAGAIRPLTETLNYAMPLIVAGLGVAMSFRAGMFNIGGQGQILIGAAFAGWVGFSFQLPLAVHLPLAVLAGIAGGAAWGFLVGFLKARTGAHEVILTIMLNYVALYLLSFMLRTPGLLQAPGSSNPQSPATLPSATLPKLLGPTFNLNIGFLLVIAATIFCSWLLNRSSLGFRFRAVGENPHAARTAGINVKNVYVYAMVISGALVGIAGATQVLGTLTTGFSSGIDAGIGFDAITVALLGRSRPWGVFGAGILFGALKAGGYAMQAANGVPIDIVLVVQSLIVLFVAAPPLVRTIFRIQTPGAGVRRVRRASSKTAVVTK